MANASIPDDIVQPFQLETAVASGRLVRLGPAVRKILSAHDYPNPVAGILAETVSLAALVAGILKFDGVFSLQVKGDGPIGIVVADLTSEGALRGYAQFRADDVAALGDSWRDAPVPHLLGGGYLSFTVDQGKETDRYQGIVELTGASLSDCAHAYFRQSGQFEGVVKLTAGKDAMGSWRSGGLLVQKMPLNLEMRCRCSGDRVENMLKSFPRNEIETLKIGDNVVVSCEFCGFDYVFSERDLDRVFGNL